MSSKLDIDYGLEEALNMGPEYPTKVFLAEPIPLTSKKRRSLPDTEFAYVAFGPKGGKVRKYPLNDASHAKNAMARLNGQYNKGKLSDTQYKKIRSRILKAYQKFGIETSAPSAIDRIKKQEVVLPMAAEPKVDGFSAKCMENKMVTKAQRREIALKNLRKAWKAKGIAEPMAGEPKPRRVKKTKTTKAKVKSGGKLTKAQRATISRRNIKKAQAARRRMGEPKPRKAMKRKVTRTRTVSPAFVYEPAPRRKKASQAGTGASRARSLSQSEFNKLEAKRLAEIQRKSEASKKSATAKKRAASRAKPKESTRGKWERTVPIGKYKGADGNVIQIKRVYSKRNPDWSNGWVIAAAAGGVVIGVGVSDLADRFIATMAPQGATGPRYGDSAIAAVRTKVGGLRLATSFVGTAVGLGGAYALGRGDSNSMGRDIGTVMLGGFGVAFGVKFLTQLVTDIVMPVVFKVDTATEESLSNRLYADKQDYSGASALDNTSNGNGSGTNAGVMGVGKRPNIYHLPSVRSGFGPVATKPIGVGCGGSGPAHSFLAAVARQQQMKTAEEQAKQTATLPGNQIGGCGGGCGGSGCGDPNIPGYMQRRGGGSTTVNVPAPYTPSVDASNVPPPPVNQPSATTPTPVPYSPFAKPAFKASATKEDLLRYVLRMPDAPSNNTYIVNGVKGVGTAGVYGHLFKKAV